MDVDAVQLYLLHFKLHNFVWKHNNSSLLLYAK